MATLDELTVRIKADASQFDREINRVGGSAGRVGAAFGGLKGQFLALGGAVAAIKLVNFTSDAVAAADALNDLSARTGVSAEYLSIMRTEIENNGGSVEQFAQALFMMNRQIGEAISGNEAAATAISRLGLNLQDLTNATPEVNFRTIAEAVSLLPTEFERAEASAALFGRGVAGLQPIIRQGAEGIDEITAKADDFGQSLSKEQLQAIDDFGDAMNSLGNMMQNLAAGAFADVVLAVQSIVSTVSDGVDQIRLLRAGGLDALNYMEKAKAGGFATTIQRGEFISKQEYGPAQKAATASVTRKQATKEIKDMAKETDTLAQSMAKVEDQSIVSARLIKDSFGDALESAAFDFENFGDSVSKVLEGIARDIARRAFIGPLSSGVSDWLMGSGDGGGGGILGDLFSGLGFADGGRPPVGKASMVGENGPELFIPDTAGTIIPNGASMGGGVSVVNTWNIQSGVTRSELAALIPVIEARSTAATLAAVERGGRASQIVGKRN